jgi:hypothetical protein
MHSCTVIHPPIIKAKEPSSQYTSPSAPQRATLAFAFDDVLTLRVPLPWKTISFTSMQQNADPRVPKQQPTHTCCRLGSCQAQARSAVQRPAERTPAETKQPQNSCPRHGEVFLCFLQGDQIPAILPAAASLGASMRAWRASKVIRPFVFSLLDHLLAGTWACSRTPKLLHSLNKLLLRLRCTSKTASTFGWPATCSLPGEPHRPRNSTCYLPWWFGETGDERVRMRARESVPFMRDSVTAQRHVAPA